MDANTASNIIQGAVALISVAALFAAFYVRSTSKGQAEAAVGPLYTARNEHEVRLVRLEEQMKYLPQQRDFQRLSDNVALLAGTSQKMGAEMHALHESLERTEKSVALITETMMTKPA